MEANESIVDEIKDYPTASLSDLSLGKYKFIKFLGRGSFARVYKAVNTENGKLVALKVVDMNEIT